jgi:carboxylesterase type B
VEVKLELIENKIFVSIQYRLLFYGDLSGNEPHALGVENLGLLDQRLAFRLI